MARPRTHLVISAGLSALLFARTRRAIPALAPLVSGVLVDVDHLIDYARTAAGGKADGGQIVLALHGWEQLTLLAWAEARLLGRRTGFGLTLGLLAHLLTDQLTNRVQHPLTYSVAFRGLRGFDPGLFGGEAGQHKWRQASLTGLWRWL